ncbi:hypothetical protein AM493_06115 [Flavobacterium akiainvivens]|uniref:Activator of Hsp90 ATPase homologue 1/2-like C-terminal domain-containing protein n=1 Tax=Flavobacterium akiainvivens TaxID=1202724 RepID=A0A0M8M9Z5_9FLAO|nr:SRPBCC domain-containing protein [Flavobacterium akiainvivens]KOS05655.1 hypothetical protein AM493_06115 [Flavobacterium akiainvivens]SFQ36106.1 Uncharacterized conserved protein YndB, AHSA1/START domain [Flavobacterium akiainvivens]
MSNNLLTATASIQVLKPVAEVFEMIQNPQKGMVNFWINKSSGPFTEGAMLQWGFPEFDEQFPVRVGKVIDDELITFYWEAENGKEHEVKMAFADYKGSTVVTITESGEPNTPEGLKWAIGNTEGWANFCACLKAWAEHGINLRKGAFDYRFEG